MTIAEMHNEFKLLIDKGDSGDIPAFLDSEIDMFINIAQHKFVNKRMFGNNIDVLILKKTKNVEMI